MLQIFLTLWLFLSRKKSKNVQRVTDAFKIRADGLFISKYTVPWSFCFYKSKLSLTEYLMPFIPPLTCFVEETIALFGKTIKKNLVDP